MQSPLPDPGEYESMHWRDAVLQFYGLTSIAKKLDLAEEKRLLLALKANPGSEELQRKVIHQYLGLVISIVKKHERSLKSLKPAELVDAGIMAVFKDALRKYDHTLDNQFSTYATWWISRAIKNEILFKDRMIYLPSTVLKRASVLWKTRLTMAEELGREPTTEELARKLEWSVRSTGKLQQLFNAVGTVLSFEQPLSEQDNADQTLGELMIGDGPDESALVDRCAKKVSVDKLLAFLAPREKQVIALRYGLYGDEPHTFEEIGKLLSVTRERARQIENRALVRIRHRFGRQLS